MMFSIQYNTEFHRWEVYRENGVIRGGEVQPVFVGRHDDCIAFMAKVTA
mgnify:CR=1 FL=1